MTIVAEFANADRTMIRFTDESGTSWSGIACHLDGQSLVVDGDTEIHNRLRLWISAGHQVSNYEPPRVTPADVNAERDRRMLGFAYGGHVFQFDATSQQNISGAATMAMMAITSGAQPGDLRWMSPAYDFSWITLDNQPVPMDAHQMLAFASAAALFKSDLIFKARQIKDMSPIPQDYKSDVRWS